MSAPLVTVVVPARNEERDIGDCLDAILAQDHPHHRLEVVVVDGASTDRTAELAEKHLAAGNLARAIVVRNHRGDTPSNLNLGLAEARGEVLCRVDARSLIPSHYVRRCAEVLGQRPEVAVVGGAQVAVPRDLSPTATGIARALNNRWGMGLARYRRGASSGPADTVYLGAFRTDDLRAAGGWDERFPTNQDFELNRRMSQRGIVWFEAGMEVGYRPRESLGDLFRQYQRFGSWKVRYWRETGDRPRPRQVAMLVVPVVGTAAVALSLTRPRRARRVAALSAASAALFEIAGPRGPSTSPAGHLVSLGASVAVAGGWTLGAWGELLRHGRC